MDRYTIYCTEAQTKKALELGAPIEIEIKSVCGNVIGAFPVFIPQPNK